MLPDYLVVVSKETPMQKHNQPIVKVALSGITLGLLLCSLPALAQTGTGSGGTTSGSGTADTGASRTDTTRQEPGFNPGWLGLLGLAGLAGLRKPTVTYDANRSRTTNG